MVATLPPINSEEFPAPRLDKHIPKKCIKMDTLGPNGH